MATARFEFSAQRKPPSEDGSFDLYCGPSAGDDRRHQLSELGYDDGLPVKALGQTADDRPQMRARHPAR